MEPSVSAMIFRNSMKFPSSTATPCPRVDELIEHLGRARYISTLDLIKGYWQVPLTAASQEKTAFSTPSGHWQYRVLPFGVHGAPATFQHMMDILLRPHQAFLGLAGYYRCFIPNFSAIACPLTDLTKKWQPETLEWTSDAEAAFQALKSALASSPVLYAPDFNCPFTLQTDVLYVALRCCGE